jgi:RNA polymerase sigma-70 factor (ECF subfamily)
MNEITAIKEGIEPAFEKVYHEFHVKTFRFFLRRVALHETAKELTQQTFIKLWRSRHTLSESFTLDTQVFTIAGTVLIDHLRKQSSRNRLHVILKEGLGNEDSQHAPSSAHAMETADYFSAAVSVLPPVRKRVMLLKTKHGFSNKEIANELSISVKAVEGHVTKAIRQIRSLSHFLPVLIAFLFIR